MSTLPKDGDFQSPLYFSALSSLLPPFSLNINQEVGSTHIAQLSELVRERGADLGIAYDGDGDRVLFVDQNGEAVDGDDAIEKFAATKPDVLLLDIDMPKKDGITTLMEIKRMDPNAKVVMVTVHDEMDMIQDCIKAGALTYIIKPFDTKQLMNAILFADQENKKS